MAEHLTIPGALEWDTVERHSIATLRYAGGKEHDVKYVSEVAYDALKAELKALRDLLAEHQFQHKPYDDFYHKESGYYCIGCGDERGKHQDKTCEVASAISPSNEGKGDE